MSMTCRPVMIGAAATGAQPTKPQRIATTERYLVVVIVSSPGASASASGTMLAQPTRSRLKGCASPNNAVPHGEAYALSRRAVGLIDHAMDAGGGQRALRHPPLVLAQARHPRAVLSRATS